MLTPQEFTQKIKSKYPVYQNINDAELIQKIITKYPVYKSQINFGTTQTSQSNIKTSDNPITTLKEKSKNAFNKVVDFVPWFGETLAKGGDIFLNPTLKAVETGIMQPIRQVQKLIPGGKTGKEEYNTPFGTIKDVTSQPKIESVMQAFDVAAMSLPLEEVLTRPISKAALKLYQSALKPADIKVAKKIVTSATELSKIGLDEAVWLTKGGVERVANKIDDFENVLGSAIEEAGASSKTINTNGLKGYIDEAKSFFSNQFDVADAKKALKEIDNISSNFIKKYGKEIPIEIAQDIKVKTGQTLRKYYDRMSSASIEATKQGVRYLKDKIIEQVPVVGDINKRLTNLYKFDQALTKSSGRIGNLNLLGLPSKIGGAIAGTQGAVAGKLLELLDAPSIKSGLAIGLDKLTKGGNTLFKGGKIPLTSLITYIVEELQSTSKQQK